MGYGKRITYFREKLNMSKRALAIKINVDPSLITKLEANDSRPSLDTLERICNTLGITLSQFFAVEENNELPFLPHDIWSLVKDSNNYGLLRLIIALKAEGISNELISEMIKYISNTLIIAKKESQMVAEVKGVYWTGNEKIDEKKWKVKKLERKIKKSGLDLGEDKNIE